MNKAADPIAAALGQTIAERGADYYRSGKILWFLGGCRGVH